MDVFTFISAQQKRSILLPEIGFVCSEGKIIPVNYSKTEKSYREIRLNFS